MPPKPPHGTPCNGCGLCCLTEPCPLGAVILGVKHGPCPAVQPAGNGRWECGIIIAPAAFAMALSIELGERTLRNAAQYLLGSGVGCDTLQDEPENPAFDLILEARADDEKFALAMLIWGLEDDNLI